jgi:hypothetical protein
MAEGYIEIMYIELHNYKKNHIFLSLPFFCLVWYLFGDYTDVLLIVKATGGRRFWLGRDNYRIIII